MKSLSDIYVKLGLNEDNGLFIFKEKRWEGLFSQKIEYALSRIEPDAFYTFKNEPLLLFFDYPEDEGEIHKRCWNFNKAPVIFINSSTELKIYNSFAFDKNKQSLFELASIEEVENFSYWNIVSGQLWEEYKQEFSKNRRVDYKLLENIETARDILKELGLESSIANKLIGRLIFIRYLIDRKIKIGYINNSKGFLTNSDLLSLILNKDAIYDFFEFLLHKFKGDLFPLDSEKNSVQQDHLNVLHLLFSGGNLKSKQLSLFDIFDFDIIPIELVSNIYEYFIGKDKKEKNKAFYTPPFLVDYILNQTIIQHFKKEENRNSLICKVLDPACGSGIFLVETLRILIIQFKELYPHITPSQIEFKEAIKELLVNNIFGIDKDRDALEIAIFSLYITLLDFFEEPKDIEGFEFPSLLGSNLIEADFFDIEHEFNKKFSKTGDGINLDFIIGNPPWGNILDSPYMEYCEKRACEENKEIKIGDKQIAQAFLIRASDFSYRNTKCCLIVTSKMLYNLQSEKFRSYFLEKFYINEVVEISSVRKQIFTRAVGPAIIISYQFAFGKPTNNNMVEYISLKPNPYFELFKSVLIEKYDYKEVLQSYFKDYSWLWQVLLYGSVLDFYLVKKLKDPKRFPETIGDIVNEKNQLIKGEGLQKTGDKNDASHLIGKLFIDTKKKDLQRYYLRLRKDSKWESPFAHRPRNKDLFKAPILLIKTGLQSDFSLVATISNKDVVFTDSIYAIKSYSGITVLEILLGLINSDLMIYFLFITGTSTGIEREQFFDTELLSFPVVLDDRITDHVQRLLQLYEMEYGEREFRLGGYNDDIEKEEKKLNDLILKIYKLNDTDRDLLDYAFKISIPILQDKENLNPFKRLTKNQIREYIELFVKHFSQTNNTDESSYIKAEVYETSHIVGINFTMLADEPNQTIIWKENNDSAEIIESLAAMAFQKVSDKLFVQKDVKGIRKSSFYVIKPNQYKYWHKAIAHLDIIEFENTMIESQLRQYQNESV